MAKLLFPDNKDVMDRGQNWFGQMWLKYLGQVHRRLGGADDIAAVTTGDISAAGVTYSQAQMQAVITLLNELKAKQNETLDVLKR